MNLLFYLMLVYLLDMWSLCVTVDAVTKFIGITQVIKAAH